MSTEKCKGGKAGLSGGVVPVGGKGDGFAFRPQHPGESKEQYEALKAQARRRWDGKPGRARAMSAIAAKAAGRRLPAE